MSHTERCETVANLAGVTPQEVHEVGGVAGCDSNALEELCSCGYVDGTFACKIRHIQLNTGDAKAASDRPAKRRYRGIETTG